MKTAAPKIYKNLVEVLMDRGLIDKEKADEINLAQLKTGDDEEEIVRNQRILSEEDLTRAKADLLRIDYVDFVYLPLAVQRDQRRIVQPKIPALLKMLLRHSPAFHHANSCAP